MPKPVAKVKESWDKQPKKRKKIIIGSGLGALGIIVLAIIITVALNSNTGYKVLYSQLEDSETTEVIAAVREMGVTPTLDNQGRIMVPSEQYDRVLLELASQGYPKSALSYDVFTSQNGLTTTEETQKTILVYQLQNRIQDTLKRINNVQDAVVTLNIPEETNYVWQTATDDSVATAGVLLTFDDPDELISEEQISAIKNLVASSVPQLEAKNVQVTNAATGLEMGDPVGTDPNTSVAVTASRQAQLEQLAQQRLEDNVERLLSSRYGSDGVVAVAYVTLNFDQMVEESKQLQTLENGDLAPSHTEQHLIRDDGQLPAGGLVGEENNTDTPIYQNGEEAAADQNTLEYHTLTDYEYGYILRQIERGTATVENASISVLVNSANVDAERNNLTALVSNATGVDVANISVDDMGIEPTVEPEPEPDTTTDLWTFVRDNWLWFVIGAGILLLLIAGVIVLIIFQRRRARKMAEAARAEAEAQARDLEDEVDQYKRQLEEAARAKVDTKDVAVTDEVRNFAKQNPEITANLLRSWLKEDE